MGSTIPLELLIADSDILFISLLGQVFKNFGITNIHYANNVEQTLDLIGQHTIDLVITDWDLPNENADGSIVQHIRHHHDPKRRKVPIMVFTGNDHLHTVKCARDAGANDFLLKPLNIRKLCHRIRAMIDDPRPFIESKHYVGPSRRRQEALPDGEERRISDDEKKKRSTREGDCVVIDMEEYKLKIYDPNPALKRKIGEAVDLNDIFSEARIKEAQEKLDHVHHHLYDDAFVHIKSLFNNLEKAQNDQSFEGLIGAARQPIQKLTHTANNLGYYMAMNAASSLTRYLESAQHYSEDRLMVMREHVVVLNVVFSQKIQGAGAEQGEQLKSYLDKLTKHYAASDAA